MKNNYLLETEDFVALKKEIEKLIKSNKFQEATKSNYDLQEVSLEKVIEDLDTYSFLSPQKIIIVQNINAISQEQEETNLKHLYKYLDNPNPDNLLIICAKKLNNTLKVTKELKKRLEYKTIEINPETFIKNELKSYYLESGVVSLLVEYCKDDITKLENECAKLKNYQVMHAFGHGVGLEIHERPYLGLKSEFSLRENMVVTDEPGIYKAGRHGIRIENTLVIVPAQESEFGTFYKFEPLTLCPIDKEAIRIDMLNDEELNWLNEYHQMVYNRLKPFLNEQEQAWLEEATSPLKR